MENKDLEKRIKKLEEENSLYKITIQKLEERIVALETGEKNTGVYLDGAPDYVQDYITKEKEEKVGE